MKTLDKFFNPENYTKTEANIGKKPSPETLSPDKKTISSVSQVVSLNNDSCGPRVPETNESLTDVLNAGRTALLPNNGVRMRLWLDGTNACSRPAQPLACKPLERQPR